MVRRAIRDAVSNEKIKLHRAQDQYVPRAEGVLSAFQEILPEYVQKINRDHMVVSLAHELIYTAALCQKLSIEVMNKYLSNNDKVKTQERLTIMREIFPIKEDGTLDKVFVTAKRRQSSAGPSVKSLQTKCGLLVTQIGLKVPEGQGYGDVSTSLYADDLKAEDIKNPKTLIDKVKYYKNKVNEEIYAEDAAKAVFMTVKNAYERAHQPIPDQDDDETAYNEYRKKMLAECKETYGPWKGWQKSLKAAKKTLVESEMSLEDGYLKFGSLVTQLRQQALSPPPAKPPAKKRKRSSKSSLAMALLEGSEPDHLTKQFPPRA